MASPKHVLLSWVKMPATERRTVIAAALLLPLLRLGIHFAGLGRVVQWTQCARQSPGEVSLADAMLVARAVDRAARRTPGGANCLARSVLLQWLLRRRGLDAQLRIGVRLQDAVLEAHAWVEYRSQPLNERLDVAEIFLPFEAPVRALGRTVT